jgi:hypothetical protein
VPRYKPLSVGVVLLDLVPADHHQPDLFATDSGRRQKLSPLIDRINNRYGRCSIGFGLFPADVRAFRGHAAFTGCRKGGSFGFQLQHLVPCQACDGYIFDRHVQTRSKYALPLREWSKV